MEHQGQRVGRRVVLRARPTSDRGRSKTKTYGELASPIDHSRVYLNIRVHLGL